jgi:hypothetical protein
MTDPVLSAGQYSIDGLVFGSGQMISIAKTEISPGAAVTQDTQLIANDGRRFGFDVLPGMAVIFTGQAFQQGDTGLAQMNAYDTFAATWGRKAVRRTPGAVSTLRMYYRGSSVTRRVYGRGRACTPVLGLASQGYIPFTAEFDCADSVFYGDVLNSFTLGTAYAFTGGGVAPPLTPPVALAAVQTANNMIPAADSDFELPWTGSWTPQTLISSLGQSTDWAAIGTHSMKAAVTGAGTAIVNYANLSVLAGLSYGAGLRVRVSSGSGTATLTGQWLNGALGVIGSPVTFGTATATTSGTGVQVGGLQSAPAGAAWLTLSLSYAAAGAVSFYADTVIVTQGVYQNNAILNSGTTDTWPVITITGPCTNPSIIYQGSSTSLTLQTALAANQTAVISTVPWNRYVGITSSIGADPYGSVAVAASLSGVVRGSPLDALMIPAGSLTPVTYSAQDLTGTSRCTVSWRNAFKMLGGSTP